MSSNVSQKLIALCQANNIAELTNYLTEIEPYSWSIGQDAIAQAVVASNYEILCLLVQHLISDTQPIDSDMRDNAAFSAILEWVIRERHPKYWILLEPFLQRMFSCVPLMVCSMDLIQHLHDHRRICESEWRSIFRYHRKDGLDQVWGIYLSPSGIETDDDRVFLQKIVIDAIRDQDDRETIVANISPFREIYPGVISDALDQFMVAILARQDDEKMLRSDMLMWVLSEESKIDLDDWICRMLPRILLKSRYLHDVLDRLVEVTKSLPVRYYHRRWRRAKQSFIISEYPLGKSVGGWTSFATNGYYLYSTDIYLDVHRERLVAGGMSVKVGPTGQAISMSNPEIPITIYHGPGYSQSMTISAPTILAEWHASTQIRAKSARSYPGDESL